MHRDNQDTTLAVRFGKDRAIGLEKAAEERTASNKLPAAFGTVLMDVRVDRPSAQAGWA